MDLKGLKFSKMHGIGNDFPIIDESVGEVIPEADKAEACRFFMPQTFRCRWGWSIICNSF